MQYDVNKLTKNNISINRSQVISVLGLYCFALVTSLLGFSVYLFLESSGIVNRVLISWSGQGLFWSFITFFVSLFILFVPIEFFNEYFIENRSFRNLLANIVSVIFISLFFLSYFKCFEIKMYFSIVSCNHRAVSFSGFCNSLIFIS